MLFFFRLELHQLEEELNCQENEVETVTLFPPQDGAITDEESGDEGEGDINHLPGRILRSEVEVTFASTSRHIHQELQENSAGTSKQRKSRKTIAGTSLKWSENLDDFTSNSGRGDTEEVVQKCGDPNLSAVQWFELLFTDELVKNIVEMSNLYAMQRNHNLNMSEKELRVYVAILLLTGYMTPKNIRMFWEIKSDTHNDAVANSMRRNRFLEIHQYLHLCDNTNLPENDKFGKVRKYLSTLSNNFTLQYENAASSHISIDETMVPYYGRHSTKQHIHGKPIRFGYKFWSAASRNGYLITFEPYQGAKSAQLPFQEEYGLGAAVILELESRLPKHLSPYNFYFDNFFTSFELLHVLSTHNNGGTGTIRENRLRQCPLTQTKLLKKEKRGSFSFKVEKNLLVLKWHDNSVVTLASNCHGVTPVQKVDRVGVVGGKRSKIQVGCPALVQKYNKYMGGVDRFDENIHSMRISFRGRKWWFPLFAFGVDAACQNAWQLMKENSENNITYCQFRRTIVQVYLHKYGSPPQKNQACGSSMSQRILPEVRLSGSPAQHVQESCTQRRCGLCHQRTRIMCQHCKIGLHVHCWFEFHSSQTN